VPADAKNTKTLDAAGEGAMMRREQRRHEQEKKKKDHGQWLHTNDDARQNIMLKCVARWVDESDG